MATAIDLAGKKFGKLLVVKRQGQDKRGNALWKCTCDCGKEKLVESSCLRRGVSTHCGCSRKTTSTFAAYIKAVSGKIVDPKGESTRLKSVWKAMVKRCYDPNDQKFYTYGDRKIFVCDEWLVYEAFFSWALANGYRKELQIDREDNNKGYCPDNCRFVTPQQNSNNRSVPSNNKTGYTGVYLRKSGSYRAYIRGVDEPMNGNLLHIGTYASAEDAVLARNEFIKENKLPHKIQEVK